MIYRISDKHNLLYLPFRNRNTLCAIHSSFGYSCFLWCHLLRRRSNEKSHRLTTSGPSVWFRTDRISFRLSGSGIRFNCSLMTFSEMKPTITTNSCIAITTGNLHSLPKVNFFRVSMTCASRITRIHSTLYRFIRIIKCSFPIRTRNFW